MVRSGQVSPREAIFSPGHTPARREEGEAGETAEFIDNLNTHLTRLSMRRRSASSNEAEFAEARSNRSSERRSSESSDSRGDIFSDAPDEKIEDQILRIASTLEEKLNSLRKADGPLRSYIPPIISDLDHLGEKLGDLRQARAPDQVVARAAALERALGSRFEPYIPPGSGPVTERRATVPINLHRARLAVVLAVSLEFERCGSDPEMIDVPRLSRRVEAIADQFDIESLDDRRGMVRQAISSFGTRLEELPREGEEKMNEARRLVMEDNRTPHEAVFLMDIRHPIDAEIIGGSADFASAEDMSDAIDVIVNMRPDPNNRRPIQRWEVEAIMPLQGIENRFDQKNLLDMALIYNDRHTDATIHESMEALGIDIESDRAPDEKLPNIEYDRYDRQTGHIEEGAKPTPHGVRMAKAWLRATEAGITLNESGSTMNEERLSARVKTIADRYQVGGNGADLESLQERARFAAVVGKEGLDLIEIYRFHVETAREMNLTLDEAVAYVPVTHPNEFNSFKRAFERGGESSSDESGEES